MRAPVRTRDSASRRSWLIAPSAIINEVGITGSAGEEMHIAEIVGAPAVLRIVEALGGDLLDEPGSRRSAG